MPLLGLSCCMWAFSGRSEQGLLFPEVWERLTSGASLMEMASREVGSLAVMHGLSCSTAWGIFLDQGLNPCHLHWQWILSHWTTGKFSVLLASVLLATMLDVAGASLEPARWDCIVRPHGAGTAVGNWKELTALPQGDARKLCPHTCTGCDSKPQQGEVSRWNMGMCVCVCVCSCAHTYSHVSSTCNLIAFTKFPPYWFLMNLT